MIKKSITFTNFNGEKVTEDHYFHLNKANLMDMEIESDVSLSDELEKISQTEDGVKVVQIFKKFVLAAYGVRSEDGKRFVKNDELREDFKNSEAYSELLFNMISDPQMAIELIEGIIPADLLDEAKKRIEGEGGEKAEVLKKMKKLEESKSSKDEDLSSLSQEELIRRLESK